MLPQIGVAVIHGMGAQKHGFMDPLRDEVSRRLRFAAPRFVWKEIYWADVLQEREGRLWEAMNKAREPSGSAIRLDWVTVRQFVLHNFGDALAYHRDPSESSTYTDVHKAISRALGVLRVSLADPAAPLIVMAHSLGAHMMSDYIWDRQNWKKGIPDPYEPVSNLVAMITFGGNIPLFSLDFDVATPIDLPGPGVTKPQLRALAKWLNYLDRDDVLGWPLKPLYESETPRLTPAQRQTVDRIEDYEINVGSFGTSWNPSAHSKYWTDDDFTGPVAAYLAALLPALDGP